jgi:transposase
MLGLDISKATLSCALIDPTTQVPTWEGKVPNSPAGVAQLLSRLPAEIAWVMEPTGRYSLSVAQQAQAAGRTVLLAPPLKAKKFLESLQDRAKTDRVDARGLGRFALSRPLTPYPIKSEAVERLQQLLTARKGLAQALASLQQQAAELPLAPEALTQAVADLKERLRELDRQLAAAQKQWPVMRQLLAVQGIGPVTAASVAACLAGKHFERADQFVAYCGLDIRIRIRDSGKRRGAPGLTKQGDAELRRLLYLAAQANLRVKGSPFAEQYERERAKGLSSTAALCAVARKLARLCWGMARSGAAYDAHRAYHRP